MCLSWGGEAPPDLPETWGAPPPRPPRRALGPGPGPGPGSGLWGRLRWTPGSLREPQGAPEGFPGTQEGSDPLGSWRALAPGPCLAR